MEFKRPSSLWRLKKSDRSLTSLPEGQSPGIGRVASSIKLSGMGITHSWAMVGGSGDSLKGGEECHLEGSPRSPKNKVVIFGAFSDKI
jgi:hypothetical protein